MRTHRWLAALVLMTASPLTAQDLADYDYEDLSFRGIGLDAGYIWPNKVGATESLGIRVDLGYLGPGIRIVPTLSYWSSSLTGEEVRALERRLDQEPLVTVPDGSLGTVEWTDVALNVNAHFVWSTRFRLLTYLGLGAGLHVLSGGNETLDGTFVDDLLDTVTAGVDAIAGLELPVTRSVRLYGEGRYTVLSDLRYATARGGIAIMVGRQDPAVVGVAGSGGGGTP